MQEDDHGSPICSSSLWTTTIWFVGQIIQHHDVSCTKQNLKSLFFLRETDYPSTVFRKWQSLKKSKYTGAVRQHSTAQHHWTGDWSMHSLAWPPSTTPTSFDLLLMFLWPTPKPNQLAKASKVHFPSVRLGSYLVSELNHFTEGSAKYKRKCKKKKTWREDGTTVCRNRKLWVKQAGPRYISLTTIN